MKAPKKNPDRFGTWTAGTLTGQLGNGECPGTNFTFGAIYYTWTKGAKSGKTDKVGKAVWTATPAGFPKQIITNLVTNVLTRK